MFLRSTFSSPKLSPSFYSMYTMTRRRIALNEPDSFLRPLLLSIPPFPSFSSPHAAGPSFTIPPRLRSARLTMTLFSSRSQAFPNFPYKAAVHKIHHNPTHLAPVGRLVETQSRPLARGMKAERWAAVMAGFLFMDKLNTDFIRLSGGRS